ncbi:LysR family transcriptional regulator ArgP [Janibacter sp. GXQ6167]|uniref:LysR family transcriptional regulator ArgP n=1 Tax=Janibacter sp. GXQ6167 TaxID=3240791 RepID=UPI003526AA32
MQLDQLKALAAIVDHGTFEAAAASLHVTPSAISQRIRALEDGLGQIILRRTTPATPTEAGAILLRTARAFALLESQARESLGLDGAGRYPLKVAVNADSLATWFAPVLAEAATWDETTLHLEVEDQDHSLDLLSRGEVVATITGHGRPVAGCRVELLGAMRYLPAAAPHLRDAWRRGRGVDWARMPMVRFNGKDDLQDAYLRSRGITQAPPAGQIPSSQAFVEAIRVGLGWGLVPEGQLGSLLTRGELVRLSRDHVDVPLYWHVLRLDSPRLHRLTAAVHRAARPLRRTS